MIKSKKLAWARHAAGTGKKRYAYKVFVTKYEGQRSLGRPKRRWDH
jgi:hypothetical protein